MSLTTWLLYLAAGRLLTWLLQVNGLTRPLWNAHPTLKELSECDLCLGFWVYLGLGFSLREKWADLWPFRVSVLVLATVTSFIAHLLRIGWQTKFGVTVID